MRHVPPARVWTVLAGPFGIVSTIVVTFMFGLAYIVAIIASIEKMDYNNTTGGPFALSYNPAAQIFWDLHETRFGNGRLCLGMWIITLMAQFLCTVSSVTSNSRMLYAFARDNAVPGSRIWHVINERVQIPVNAVCGMSVAALLIALPTVQSVEAVGAVTSIATIGLYVSYIIPIACRLTVGRKEFVPGPFYLGGFSVPIACIATCWVVIICVFFVLPNTFPIDMALNFNCASRVSREADNASLSYADNASLVRRRHHRRGRGTGVLVVHLVSSRPRPFNARTWFSGPNLTYSRWPPAGQDCGRRTRRQRARRHRRPRCTAADCAAWRVILRGVGACKACTLVSMLPTCYFWRCQHKM